MIDTRPFESEDCLYEHCEDCRYWDPVKGCTALEGDDNNEI